MMDLFENLQMFKEAQETNNNKHLKLCDKCLAGIESTQGKQIVNELNPKNYDSVEEDEFGDSLYNCDWCNELFSKNDLNEIKKENYEYTSISFEDKLKKELYASATKLMTSKFWGFPEDEIKDYLDIDVYTKDGDVIVSVGAEVSYNALEELGDELNKVINKYDKDSYFDMECPGRMIAYLFNYKTEDYNDDFIKIANKTSRTSGASALNKDGSIRSVTAKYVKDNVSKDASILDFGAGKDAVQTQVLRDNGFKNITAYDFGSNVKDGIHDPNALNKTYDVVFASNVINTSSDESMVRDTLRDMWKAVKSGGQLIFNYPSSPRKAGLSTPELQNIVEDELKQKPEVVASTKSAPVWKIVK